jgi:hypothetical protein
MMSPHQLNPPSRRPRGRPKGTTKFEQEDRRLLAEFAELAIGSPHAKLAPFLASHGYEQKDVRRAQKRWREETAVLMHQAQLRADASPAESLVELIAGFVNTISDVAEAVGPALGKLAESLERSRRRAAAHKAPGLDLSLPLDFADPGAVDRAIRRYEKTISAGHEPAEFEPRTLDELPGSLKLYSAALILHELSIKAAEAESQEAVASGDKAAAPKESE